MAKTWVSKDTSKSYYGKEVYVSSSGKIQSVDSVGVLPSGRTFNVSETSPAVQAQLSGKTTSSSSSGSGSTTKYFLEAEGKKIQVSQALQEKVIADQKAAEAAAAKPPTPTYTLTSKGVAYTDTGQLVKDARTQQIKANAFQYLAPVEKFIATRAGSKEVVYERVVKPKMWLASKSDLYEQQWLKTGSGSARAKSLLAEAGTGAFSLVTAPVETVGAVLVTKTFPVGSAANVYTGGTSFGVAIAPASMALGSVALNPKDPAKGAARLAGMAAVTIGVSKGIDATGGKNIPKWGTENIEYNLPKQPKPVGERLLGSRYSASRSWQPITAKESPVAVKQAFTQPTVRAYSGIKFGDRPLIGRTFSDAGKGRLTFGSPSLRLSSTTIKGLDLQGYVPSTRTEARFAQQIADTIYTPTEATKSRLAVDLISGTERTRSPLKGAFPEETRTLSKKGTDIVKQFARKEKALAYGSYTADPQLPKGSLASGRGVSTKQPYIGDIDLQLKVGDAASAAKAKSLAAQLKAAGEPVRISRQTPTLIESFKSGKWSHAVDIHSIDQPLDADIPLEQAWGFKFDHTPTKIEGVKSMPLSEFRTRKAASILTFRQKGFAPEAHRLKDIPDFLTSQEYLSRVASPQDLGTVGKLRALYGNVGAGSTVSVPIYSPPAASPSVAIAASAAPAVGALSGSVSRARSPSPSRSLSASLGTMPASLKIIRSPSGSIPASVSAAPSFSPSPSRSVSRSISPSVSISPSRSVSPSRSISPSLSLSPPSVSPSPSPSPSISPSPSVSPSVGSPSFGSPTPVFKKPKISLPYAEFGGGGRRAKPVKFKPKYFASIEASVFKIKGKPSKFAIASGLGTRPIAWGF